MIHEEFNLVSWQVADAAQATGWRKKYMNPSSDLGASPAALRAVAPPAKGDRMRESMRAERHRDRVS